MKSSIFSTLLVLVVAALSSSNHPNVADAKESVAIFRRLRALGSDGSSWGGDNGRDHPSAATLAPVVAVRRK